MLQDVYEKALAGEITREDALALLQENPFELFETADRLRKEIVGDEVTFVANRLIDITDRCVIGCHFCSFRNSVGYELTREEILARVGEAKAAGATEVCLIAGVLPKLNVEYYADLFRAIKAEHDLMIHALSPMEVFYAARSSGVSTEEALQAFKGAGMDTMTGASAEILVDSVREKICPKKVTVAEWVRIITEAHRLGIPTTSSMLHGTVETWEDRIDHMLLIRDIQRKTGGFTEFIPLTFMHENNQLSGVSTGASGMEDLLVHALARIIFGREVPNIQASWTKMGVKLSQVTLCCGANDFGGTMMEDLITVAGGARHGDNLTKEQIRSAIRAIGRIPRERNTLYEYLD